MLFSTRVYPSKSGSTRVDQENYHNIHHFEHFNVQITSDVYRSAKASAANRAGPGRWGLKA